MQRILGATIALSLWACSDENCHRAEHVGAFTGDADGAITITADRVDDENLLHIELTSADDGVHASATAVVVEARESGCSDWTFEGDLSDGGTIEGVLTTTTGEGTWTLDDGRTGTWSWGRR